MKNISILGSTGSIGTQSIEVINRMKNQYNVKYLSANKNVQLLLEQSKVLKPNTVCVGSEIDEDIYYEFKKLNIEVLSGEEGLLELSSRSDIDLVVNGLVGYPGMAPTIAAIKSGVNVALSNKESLVMAGEYIYSLLKNKKVQLFPVDSEHSAIWQCLVGEKINQVNKLILTGSGGPFRTIDKNQFSNITKFDALKHPNWSMGKKITIDSATMMNKGLEVIEAKWLFNINADDIDILIHPESIIHSMVEFVDGSIKAQLGLPDMKIPIQYALTYPNHTNIVWDRLDLSQIGLLTFHSPDIDKFPCIKLAYDVLHAGDSYPVVLNVANDCAVYAFLDDKIKFVEISSIIEEAISKHPVIKNPDLSAIQELIFWTKDFVNMKIKQFL